MIRRPSIPGLFITATDTNVGKTFVTAAIAVALCHRGKRVAVCKPLATGGERRGETLISSDAEYLAKAADTPFPLHVVCPQVFVEPLAPAVAAERAGVSIDWPGIQRSLDEMSAVSDVLLVEGVGGLMVPLDGEKTVLDLAIALALPTVIVARPSLGTINHTVLTIDRLKLAGVPIAGVVVNRCSGDTPGAAEATSPRWIERMTGVRVLCYVLECEHADQPVPSAAVEAVSTVDWERWLSAEHA